MEKERVVDGAKGSIARDLGATLKQIRHPQITPFVALPSVRAIAPATTASVAAFNQRSDPVELEREAKFPDRLDIAAHHGAALDSGAYEIIATISMVVLSRGGWFRYDAFLQCSKNSSNVVPVR